MNCTGIGKGNTDRCDTYTVYHSDKTGKIYKLCENPPVTHSCIHNDRLKIPQKSKKIKQIHTEKCNVKYNLKKKIKSLQIMRCKATHRSKQDFFPTDYFYVHTYIYIYVMKNKINVRKISIFWK